MLTLTDDAHLVAALAEAAVRGVGFPDPAAAAVMGATDMLHLHLATLLVALGLPALASVWALNIGAVATVAALVGRRSGFLPGLAVAGLAVGTHALLIGAGAGLFLALSWLAAQRFAERDGGWWAGLAAGVRAEALPAVVVGAWARWRAGDRLWAAQAAAAILAVVALNLLLWGTALPVTLAAKQALLWRLAGPAPGLPPLLWLVAPLLLLLWRGWRPGEGRLLGLGAILGGVWAALGTAPGAAPFIVGGLCWLALAARAPRLGRWAAPALLAAGLATLPLAQRSARLWADHHRVATEVAGAFPERGCTLAHWYLGYLTAATDACVLDGSGFFDERALGALREAPTAEAARQAYGDQVVAVVQFHEPGAEPTTSLGTWPTLVRVQGRFIQAVLYVQPDPVPE